MSAIFCQYYSYGYRRSEPSPERSDLETHESDRHSTPQRFESSVDQATPSTTFRWTPRDLAGLIKRIKKCVKRKQQPESDWKERRASDREIGTKALEAVSDEGIWSVRLWSQALGVWTSEEFLEPTWLVIGELLKRTLDESLVEMAHPVRAWLEEQDRASREAWKFFGILLGAF